MHLKLILLLSMSLGAFAETAYEAVDKIEDKAIVGKYILKHIIDSAGKTQDLSEKKISFVISPDEIKIDGLLTLKPSEIQRIVKDGKIQSQYVLFTEDSEDVYSLMEGKPPKSDVVLMILDENKKIKIVYSGFKAEGK